MSFQSKMQRIFGFIICLGLGIFCMTLSTLYIPVLILKARKFALLFSLGSLCFILRWSILSHRHLQSSQMCFYLQFLFPERFHDILWKVFLKVTTGNIWNICREPCGITLFWSDYAKHNLDHYIRCYTNFDVIFNDYCWSSRRNDRVSFFHANVSSICLYYASYIRIITYIFKVI